MLPLPRYSISVKLTENVLAARFGLVTPTRITCIACVGVTGAGVTCANVCVPVQADGGGGQKSILYARGGAVRARGGAPPRGSPYLIYTMREIFWGFW